MIKSCLRYASLATALFGLITIFFRQVFLADDYLYLAAHATHSLSLETFGILPARLPLPTFISYLIFSIGTPNLWIFQTLFFFFYALGYFLILGQLAVSWNKEFDRLFKFGFLACFVPTLYEITYWLISMPYMIGVFILGFALVVKKPWLRIVLLAVAISFYESLVFPAFGLLLLTRVSEWRHSLRAFVKLAGQFALSGLLVLVARRVLQLWFAPSHYEMAFDASHILVQAYTIFFDIFSIHFYRTNWALTVAVWLSIAICIFTLVRHKRIALTTIVGLLAAVFASGFHGLILNYDAPRAYFGSIIFASLLLAILLDLQWQSAQAKWLRVTPSVLVGLAFFLGHVMINIVKDRNARQLEKFTDEIADQARSCASPCVIEVSDPNENLKGDWVLPEFAQGAYLRWLESNLSSQTGKDVRLQLKHQANG